MQIKNNFHFSEIATMSAPFAAALQSHPEKPSQRTEKLNRGMFSSRYQSKVSPHTVMGQYLG